MTYLITVASFTEDFGRDGVNEIAILIDLAAGAQTNFEESSLNTSQSVSDATHAENH